MFLPDGKALIMDNELYRQTIDRSIVIDLIDNNQPTSFNESSQAHSNNLAVENGNDQASQGNNASRNNHKEINRKPSQANQKRSRHIGPDTVSLTGTSQNPDTAQSIDGQIPLTSTASLGGNATTGNIEISALAGGLTSISEEGIINHDIGNFANRNEIQNQKDLACLLN